MRALLFALLAVALKAESFPEVEKAMAEMLAAREVAGVVTVVGDREGTRHLAAQGFANVENQEKMTTEHLFWIASMTKLVTGVAVMMMVEEGRVKLEDPVSRYCPEFKGLKNGNGEAREVTVLQCLTHTCGFAELSRAELIKISKLAELTKLVAQKPLQFEPGSRWQYCDTGINTAGRIVEVASGMELPEFFEKRIFRPLGMRATTFYLSAEQQKSLATTYRQEAGQLFVADIHFLRGRDLSDPRHFPMANGGLFSTAEDYGKFARMLLRGGELDGKRLLKEGSVATFREIDTGALETGFTPGNGWGVGCCVVRAPQGVSGTLSAGTYGHGGVFGTQAWIDPVKGNYQLLFVQRANFANSDASPVRRALHEAVAESL